MASPNSAVVDLRTTIIPKSDQLNADDLIGRSITIKVTAVKLCGEPDQPIAIHFEGDNGKPYKPGKSMRRVMVNVWGPDGSKFVGRRMTLYRDDTVRFGGIDVGGIRISHMSDIDRDVTMALTATRANRKPFTVRPLPAETGTPEVNLQAILANGRAAAKLGSAALTEWWSELNKAEKAAAKPTLDAELKAAASAADQAAMDDEPASDGDDDFPGTKARLTLAGRIQGFKDDVKAARSAATMRSVRQGADQLFRDVDGGDPEETGVTARGLDRWFDDQLEAREAAEREAQG